jgi:hypothetical protein
LGKSATLEAVSKDLCSPSYLCKIERNQIAANQYILQEVCERVDISKKQQKMLLNFYDILLSGVKSFVIEDKKSIKKYIECGKGFENYRYRILLLIYQILEGDYKQAEENTYNLLELVSTMLEKDMVIFSLFSAILKYKEKDYIQAFDILNALDTTFFNNDLFILYYEYLFYSSLMLGSIDTGFYYHRLTTFLIDTGVYQKLEDIHYAMGIYAIKFGSPKILEKTIYKLQKEENKNSLYILSAYKDKDMNRLEAFKDKPCNPFCQGIFAILDSKTAQMELIEHSTSTMDSFDYSTNLLKYFMLNDPKEKLSFIQKALPYYRKVRDYYVTRYFAYELSRLSSCTGAKESARHYLELLRDYETL